MTFHLDSPIVFILLALILYIFIYLPIKLAVKIFAKGSQLAHKSQELRATTIVAVYEPPASLSPAEIGYLYDSKLQSNELFATLVDFDQKGLIRLESSDDAVKISSVQSSVTGLGAYETFVLDKCRSMDGSVVTKHFLKSLLMPAKLRLNSDLRVKGFLLSPVEQIKRSALRILFILVTLIGIFPYLVFRPRTFTSFEVIGVFVIVFMPLYILATIFLYASYVKITGETWLGTPKLKQLWPELEGYKTYIKEAELDTLQYDSDDLKVNAKNKSYPYAIALGYNVGWRKHISSNN